MFGFIKDKPIFLLLYLGILSFDVRAKYFERCQKEKRSEGRLVHHDLTVQPIFRKLDEKGESTVRWNAKTI